MADVVLRAQQVQSTPAGYTVADKQEIVVKSVRAVVDGSGAASSFLPVLQLKAPDGSIVWEAASSTTVAAGGSAAVSWFPRVGFGVGNTLPGQVLQEYDGAPTAADFSFATANTELSSGYPSNSTFTKLVDNSWLWFSINGDFTTGPANPDVIAMGLFVDGVLEENIFHHVCFPGRIATVTMSKFSFTSFAAGAHTLDIRVFSLVGGANTVFRCSSSVDMSILEVVAL